jgi:hypothetical protein
MGIQLDPLRTYTIFLLPFAYQPDEKANKENLEKAGSITWRPLDWLKVSEPSSEEIAEFKKKKELEYPQQPNKIDEAVQEFVRETTSERSSVWRLQYYMPETNYVLYRHARWFELCNSDGSAVHQLSNSTKLGLRLQSQTGEISSQPVDVHWIRLILFEYSAAESTIKSGSIPFARNGILAIKLGFNKESKPTMEHLLLLNEAFRYYKIPYYQHPKYGFKRHDIIDGLAGPHENAARARSYWEMWDSLLAYPVRDNAQSFNLMPKEWHDNARVQAMADNFGDSISNFDKLLDSSLTGSKPSWDIYPDNRAFVWTCAKLVDEKQFAMFRDFPEYFKEIKIDELYKYNLWHALLDVDAKADEIEAFRYEWLKNRTYMRWAKEGTIYGFNNYSVALLGNAMDHIVWHFETIYLDMGLMLLQVRTSLFRLSQQISFDSKDRIHGIRTKWEQLFRDLRGYFAAFVNLYQFPLLSTQQQGVEIYTKMRKWLDVDEIYQEVKTEIESTHEHAELDAEKSTEEGLRTLTIYGLAIASGALVGQIFGMTYVTHDLLGWTSCRSFMIQLGSVLVFAFIGYFAARRRLKKGRKKNGGRNN